MEMVSEFCMKSVPFSGTELTERTKESTYLIGVIGAICDASQLAAKRPEQAGQIYTATEEFSAKVHMHGYNSRSADQLAEDIASIVAA